MDNVASYHGQCEDCKALEMHTLLEGLEATCFVQQHDQIKGNWPLLKHLLKQNFVHQIITRIAIRAAQFATKLNHLYLRADPSMSK